MKKSGRRAARTAALPALRQPTQSRSRESTETLLEIGRRIIEERGVDDCSMNEVAAAAGSSVGALYFRFGNKERFVSEVMQRQVDDTAKQIPILLAEIEASATSPADVIEATIQWFVLEFGKNRGLLRAQIRRALDNPQEWQPFQQIARDVVDGAIGIIKRLLDGKEDDGWQRDMRVAMQMVLGTLNNIVINRPGPLELSNDSTSRELSRAATRFLGWNSEP